MDPQVLQAAERVLAWCRAQVWESVVNGAEPDFVEPAADSDWPASMPDTADQATAATS